MKDLAQKYQKRYGHGSAKSGAFVSNADIISSGILSLDYALGTKGYPYDCAIEVYGPPDIGKSSILGFSAVVEAQKLGHNCGWIAVEPNFTAEWASKNGIDMEKLLVLWPEDGKIAFDMLYDLVVDPDIKLIVFDSIGALLRPTEAEAEGKPSQGGQSALITWGIKRIIPLLHLHGKLVIFINQIRDLMNSPYGGVDSPGGHALRHLCDIRIQLRPGKDRYIIKEDTGDGSSDVLVGRSIVAEIKRTKKDEGTGRRAVFTHFSRETDKYPFGIDVADDVINTGKRTGVITGSSWLENDLFPGGKLHGKPAVVEFLRNEPELVEKLKAEIRNHE